MVDWMLTAQARTSIIEDDRCRRTQKVAEMLATHCPVCRGRCDTCAGTDEEWPMGA